MDELKDKLCYLATPYEGHASGDLDVAFYDACLIACHLRRQGLYVHSPIVEGHAIASHCGIDPRSRAFFLHNNRMMMGRSDVLIVAQLPGWRTSEGVLTERCAFEIMRKPVYLLDPTTMELTRENPPKPPRERVEGRSEEAIESERRLWLAHGKTPSEQSGASA